MKIILKADNIHFTIRIPLAVFRIRLVQRIICKSMKYPPDGGNMAQRLTPSALDKMCTALKEWKKNNGSLILFEAHEKDGDTIKIVL